MPTDEYVDLREKNFEVVSSFQKTHHWYKYSQTSVNKLNKKEKLK